MWGRRGAPPASASEDGRSAAVDRRRRRRRTPADFWFDVAPAERAAHADTLRSSELSHQQSRAGVRDHASIASLLRRRQSGGERGLNPTAVASRYPANAPLIPNLLTEDGQRVYNTKYSLTGDGHALLVTSSQDEMLRVYSADTDAYTPVASIPADAVSWTITSIDMSGDTLVYSTMNSRLHLVRLREGLQQHFAGEGTAASSAPPAAAGAAAAGGAASRRARGPPPSSFPQSHVDLGDPSRNSWSGGFGVYSVVFGAEGQELVAGCSDNALRVYDLVGGRVSETIYAHGNDINAVCFLDSTSKSNVLLSGSDDALIKVWDRRLMDSAAGAGAGAGAGGRTRTAEPAGVLLGHTQGITSLCAKGDGFHVLSNSKDQTAKLFDLRRMGSPATACIRDSVRADGPLPRTDYDYRMGSFPGWSAPPHRLSADRSLVTYRGHVVVSTLIRATFSSAAATGQRYVLTGSADKNVYMYDTLTGEVVAVLRGHDDVVRDVTAHPLNGQVASGS